MCSVRNGKGSKDARVDMIPHLVIKIIGGVIPAEWELSTIVNWYRRQRRFFRL